MVSYTAHCVTGYYEYWKKVTVDKRLPGCEYGQCGIILEPGCERLVSYDMIVAEKTADGWLKVYACPSRTTANHLSKWGKGFDISYRRMIDLLYRRRDLNLYTGEERDSEIPHTFPYQFIGEELRK